MRNFAAEKKLNNHKKTKKDMRKTLLIITVLAATVQAWAQEENKAAVSEGNNQGTVTLIPKLGLNYSTVSLDTWPGKSSGTGKPDISGLVGIVAGVEAEFKVQPWLGISAALLYSMQGRKYDDKDVVTNPKDAMILKEYHHYLNIPVTANFYVIKGLALRTGLQLGYLFHQSGTLETPNDNFPSHSISGSPGKLDLSIPVGVSYSLDNGLQFDLRYNHGLTKLSWSEGVREEKNRVVQLTVGYRLDMRKISNAFKHKK